MESIYARPSPRDSACSPRKCAFSMTLTRIFSAKSAPEQHAVSGARLVSRLGTGIGSAFAIDGHLVTEGPGVPSGGEIWNLPYRGGIVEDFVSSRAIVGNYERRTGKKCEVVDLAAAALSDPAAQQAFVEFGDHLGIIISTLLVAFRADVIVLGGGISRSADLFLPAVQAHIGDSPIQLRVSELKDKAALVGCGVAAFRNEDGPPDAGKSTPMRSAAV